LCTPIEQREIFLRAFPPGRERPAGEIHSIFGSNGAMYKRFDLCLPKGSKLSKFGEDGFTLTTGRFILHVAVEYSGFCHNMPNGFQELYLSNNGDKFDARYVNISLSGRIFLKTLLSSSGWEYHDWLDSFRLRIKENYDINHFYNRINWDIVSPIYKVGIPIFRRLYKQLSRSRRASSD
ncbi:MAG: hypothetical protein ACKO96_06275, partial [Flammeovirgaceae bacterium]